MANAKRETKATAKTVDVEVVADSDARERAQQAVKALEEGTAEVVALVGVGLQVGKTVAAAELVKRSMLGVHQCTTYAPVTVKNAKATQIRIELAMSSSVLDVTSPGYQEPGMGTSSPARKRKPTMSFKREATMPMKKKMAKAFHQAQAKKHEARRGDAGNKNAAPSA